MMHHGFIQGLRLDYFLCPPGFLPQIPVAHDKKEEENAEAGGGEKSQRVDTVTDYPLRGDTVGSKRGSRPAKRVKTSPTETLPKKGGEDAGSSISSRGSNTSSRNICGFHATPETASAALSPPCNSWRVVSSCVLDDLSWATEFGQGAVSDHAPIRLILTPSCICSLQHQSLTKTKKATCSREKRERVIYLSFE